MYLNVQNPQEDVCEESHLIRTARILSKTSAILKNREKKKSWFISFKLKKNCVNKVLPTDIMGERLEVHMTGYRFWMML